MKSLAAILFAAIVPLHAQQPDPNAMIRNIRLSATLTEMDLKGQVRAHRGGKLPIHLFVRAENMQFHLGANDRFHIRMGDEECKLMVLDDKGKDQGFPASKLTQPIANTDVTYEDLTLRFLYWPNAKLEGEEKVNGAECYRIRLNNPGKAGAYGTVYVWVHKKYGAFWQVRAHDRTPQGNLLKEFQVSDVMKLPKDKGYTIQRMRVNAYAGGRVKSITYLEFEKP